MPIQFDGFSRRELLSWTGTTIASLALGPTLRLAQADDAKPSSFRFAHLTDAHVQPELGAAEGWKQCLAKVNAMNPRPDFIITGGDLVMDCLVPDAARIDLQWKLFDEGLKSLEVPAYHVIGNHDVGGWAPKSVLPKEDRRYGKNMFCERFGQAKPYRSFDHKGWHFVLLDSIGPSEKGGGYIGLIDEAQLEWLKNDLQAAGKESPKVFVTHIPFYSTHQQYRVGPGKPVPEAALVTNVFQFRELLREYNVRLVLSGHGHIRERIEFAGTTHIQSGAVSGAWWKGRVMNDPEAMGVITCRATDFEYQYQDYGWMARPS